MNLFILIASLFFILTNAELTEEIFYKADANQYTKDFCSKITANDFISTVKTNHRDAEKPAAFKTLFGSCRDRFLHDSEMAKHIIVLMVYTGNTEYLPDLLDRGVKKDIKAAAGNTAKEPVYDNINMDKEIVKLVEYYLFVVNAFPAPDTTQYFFLIRHPERALAYILAYTEVSESKKLEELRSVLENFNNHPSKGQYTDAKSIEEAISLVDKYLSKSETVGNHKFLLPAKIEDDKVESKESGDIVMIFGIILGSASILAVVLGLLRKFNSK